MSKHTPGPWFIWKELAMRGEGLDADEMEMELLDYQDHEICAGTPTECTRGTLRGHTAQICTVDAGDWDFDDDEDANKAISLANARLIAAAPELLEALLTARDHIEMAALEISHCKDAERIRAAIAQATGEAA